jgi:hypothetical protein
LIVTFQSALDQSRSHLPPQARKRCRMSSSKDRGSKKKRYIDSSVGSEDRWIYISDQISFLYILHFFFLRHFLRQAV